MFGIKEITVQELARRRASNDKSFFLLDVREPMEIELADLGEEVLYMPLSQLVAMQTAALPKEAEDKEAELVIMCHHGNRSAQVTAWLTQLGWKNVYNLVGGIDAYAFQIDPKVGRY